MYVQPEIKSSYEQNALGKTLYDLVLYHKPKKIIDFGTLGGYSTISMAQAVRENGSGTVHAYDLFNNYEFNHVSKEVLEKNIAEYGYTPYVEVKEVNFFDWLKTDEDFDMLHLDISNDGDVIDALWEKFKDSNKLIFFEGGSEMRDRVGWLKVWNKKPINKSVAKFEIINERYPSISQLSCQK